MTIAPLGPLDHGRRMSVADFGRVEADGNYRFELHQGSIEVSDFSDAAHSQVMSNLYFVVGQHSRAHPEAILQFGGSRDHRLDLPEVGSSRHPDFALILHPASKSSRRPLRPSLAAEVVSVHSRHRDYVVKREEYLAFGLLEYWIIDFALRRVTVLVRDGDAWREQILVDDQVIPSVVLPGLTTTVADLWLDLDCYDADDPDEEVGPAA